MDSIRVILHEGVGLKPCDKSGLSDPYCVIYLGELKKTSKVIKKTLNPVWDDEEFIFEYRNEGSDLPSQLAFSVFDWNRLEKHELMGSASLKLASLAKNEPVEVNLPIEGGTGTLYATVTHYTADVGDQPQTTDLPGKGRKVVPGLRTVAQVEGTLDNNSGERSISGAGSSPTLRAAPSPVKARSHTFNDSSSVNAFAAKGKEAEEQDVTKQLGHLEVEVGELLQAKAFEKRKVSITFEAGINQGVQSSKHKVRNFAVSYNERLRMENIHGDAKLKIRLVEAHARAEDVELLAAYVDVTVMRRAVPESLTLPLVDTNGEIGARIKLTFTYTPERSVGSSRLVGWQNLEVMVVSAKNLRAFDFGGKSDPYVILKLAGNEDKRTMTKVKELNPTYMENFSLKFNPDTDPELIVEMYDWDRGSKDDLMGVVKVYLNSLPLQAPVDQWFALDGNAEHGEIRLSLTATSMTDSTTSKTAAAGDYEPVGFQAGDTAPPPTPRREKATAVDTNITSVTKHTLVVRVLGARSLLKKDIGGKSDPYALVRVGTRVGKTSVVKKNLNPVWTDEVFTFYANGDQWMRSNDHLEVSLLDWDRTSKHEPLGQVSIDLADLLGGPDTQRVENWFDLAEGGKGAVHLVLEYTRAQEQQPESAMGEATENSDLLSAEEQNAVGYLSVRLQQGFQLVAKDMLTGKSDPYVELRVGDQVMRSDTKMKTLNPTWDQDFLFKGVTRAQEMVLTVRNWNRGTDDDDMGVSKLSLKKVQSKRTLKYWLPVEGENGAPQGELKIRLHFLESANVKRKIEPGDMLPNDVLLQINVLEGADLSSKTRKGVRLNPYVVARLAEQEWESPTMKQTNDPTWGATCNLACTSGPEEKLEIEVYDGSVPEPELIGKLSMPVSTMKLNVQVDDWFKLQEAATGKVRLRILKKNTTADRKAREAVVNASGGVVAEGAGVGDGANDTSAIDAMAAAAAGIKMSFSVEIIEARGLASPNQAPDRCCAYVQALCGPQERATDMVRGIKTPRWHESFTFANINESDTLKLTIFEWSRTSADVSLGFATLGLRAVPLNVPTDLWLNLEGALDSAEILVQVRSWLGGPSQKEVAPISPTAAATPVKTGAVPNTILHEELMVLVNLIEGRNLEAKDVTGTSDPYCEFALQGATQRSFIHKNTLNPAWHEKFEMKTIGTEQPLRISVFDWNRFQNDKSMGTANVPLDQLKLNRKTELWVPLEGATGELHLELTLRLPAHLRSALSTTRAQTAHVTLLEATGLRGSGDGGVSHPYVVMTVGPKAQTSTTGTATSGDCAWKETFRFRYSDSDVLNLQIFDWAQYSEAKSLGFTLLPFQSLTTDDVWLNVEGLPGARIHLQVITQANGDNVPVDARVPAGSQAKAPAKKIPDHASWTMVGVSVVVIFILLAILNRYLAKPKVQADL